MKANNKATKITVIVEILDLKDATFAEVEAFIKGTDWNLIGGEQEEHFDFGAHSFWFFTDGLGRNHRFPATRSYSLVKTNERSMEKMMTEYAEELYG